MGPILPAPQGPTRPNQLQQMFEGISHGAEAYMNKRKENALMQKQQEEANAGREFLSQILGMELPENMDPELIKASISPAFQMMNKQGELSADQRKALKEQKGFVGALDMIDRMEELGSTGDLGWGSQFMGYINPDVREKRAEYEQLGKSLISFATSIPLRNRLEFETYADKLTDPSLTDAERKGILSALKRNIMSSLNENFEEETNENISPKNENKERPPLKSFYK